MKQLIIIGAGRSGTNMLRDILSSAGAISTWPCDEINYIWRYRNASQPTDVFSGKMVNDSTKFYVKKQFEKIAKENKTDWVLEKTCANTLRIPFINEIFPDAKFIHIIRDGRDVACSAKERWTAKLDLPYLMKKARYVPLRDLPYYASKYAWSRLYKCFSSQKRVSTWGPRFKGIDDVFRTHSLTLASAIQWQECVKTSIHDFKNIDKKRVVEIKYEDFTYKPAEELEKIISYFKLPMKVSDVAETLNGVSTKSVGRWHNKLSEIESEQIISQCGELLKQLGYE